MTSQGLVDIGKQKLGEGSLTNIEFNDLGSTEDLILEENRGLERMPSKGAWKRRFLASILGVLLIALFCGVLAFTIPRKPEVSLVSFEYDESKPSEPDENGQLLTNWIGKISIKSHYFFDAGIKSIDVNAYIPSNEKAPVGFGDAKDITIKSRAETIVALNFKVPVYQPSSGNPSLIEECMEKSKISLLIKADIDLAMFHWTGKKMHHKLTKTVDCALPQLYALLKNNGIKGQNFATKELDRLKGKKLLPLGELINKPEFRNLLKKYHNSATAS